MADLLKITNLSGLTITSDQIKGTDNPNATFTVANVTTNQRDKLENVTPYIVNGKTVKVKPGTRIYNITTKTEQVFLEGVWQDIVTGEVKAGQSISFSGTGGNVIFNTDTNASVQIQQVGEAGKTIIRSPEMENDITYIFPSALPDDDSRVLGVLSIKDKVITLAWVAKA